MQIGKLRIKQLIVLKMQDYGSTQYEHLKNEILLLLFLFIVGGGGGLG